jgi:hypothetical protein
MGEYREGLGSEFGGSGRHKDLATAWASHLKKMRRLTVVTRNVPWEPLEAAGIGKAETLDEVLRYSEGSHVIVLPDAPYTVGRIEAL